MKTKQFIVLSVLLSSGAALAYEILAASALVNLLGSSIYYFSLIIGIFLSALGMGGWLSSKISGFLFEKLVIIEIALAFLGGALSTVIFGSYVFVFEFLGTSSFNSISGFLVGLGLSELIFFLLSFSFIAAVGVLAGFELPIFSRILAEKEILKNALGNVLFWDYAGAVLISVLMPLFFISTFGVIKTSFLMGVINAFAALLLVAALRSQGVSLKPIFKIGIAVVFLFNVFGFLNGEEIELFFEKKQYGGREILYHAYSPYQRFSFVRAEDGKISFYINGQRQFESGEWDAVYHESFVHPAMSVAKSRDNVLVLGGGDGLALREILKYPEVKKVTLVDIDRAIVAAATDFEFMKSLNENSFSDPRTKIVIDDAFKFVERGQKLLAYDAIFIDFPDPSDDGLARLYSKEFYEMLKNILNNEGVIVVQSSGYFTEVQRIILRTLGAAGLHALAYHPPQYDLFDQNFGFTLAAKKEIKKEDFDGKSVTVSASIFKNDSLADIFNSVPIPKGENQRPRVNSIFHPNIFKAYGDVFAGHYLESRPKEKIFAQINMSTAVLYQELERLFYDKPLAR